MTTAVHDSPPPPLSGSRAPQRLILALGAALLVYVLYHFGSPAVWKDLRSIGWRLAIIVALEFLIGALSALGWWHVFPRQTRRGSFKRLFLVRLAGSAVNQTTPGASLGGEPVKVILLKDRFPISLTTASLLSVKLAESLARTMFIIFGLLLASWTLRLERLPLRALSIGFILTACGVGAFMAIQLRGLAAPAAMLSGRLRFVARWIDEIERFIHRIDQDLHELYTARPMDFVCATALALAGLGVGVMQVWLMLGWMGLQRTWLSAVAIEAFSVLVNFVLFIVPGSLGVQEGGKLLIFAALGLPVSAGLSIGVAFRLNSLLSVAAGLTALMWLRMQQAAGAAAGRASAD